MAANPPFMSGVPELLILRLLKAREECMAMKSWPAIRAATGGVVSLKEGVVYPLLHALEEDGLLKTQRRPAGAPHPGLLRADLQGRAAAVRPHRRMAAAGRRGGTGAGRGELSVLP